MGRPDRGLRGQSISPAAGLIRILGAGRAVLVYLQNSVVRYPAMIPNSVIHLLEEGTEAAAESLLADQDAIFLVDWREEDDAIIGLCENILRTGDLSAELVDIDDDPGFEIYINHGGRRVKVPLVIGPEDRHITIDALNRLLMPEFEIRVCVDSTGSDTLAFLPLPASDWQTLEGRFGGEVNKRFRKVESRPNLFTDAW